MPLRLSVDQLRRMVPHVNYEISRMHLWSTTPIPIEALAFNDEVRAWVHGLINQGLVESALLHMRVVNEFLTDERPTQQKWEMDIVADDYFDEGWPRKPSNLLSDELIDLNRRLAHVSIYRLEDETVDLSFEWTQVFERAPIIFEAFRQFVYDLTETHGERGEWFADDEPFRIKPTN